MRNRAGNSVAFRRFSGPTDRTKLAIKQSRALIFAFGAIFARVFHFALASKKNEKHAQRYQKIRNSHIYLPQKCFAALLFRPTAIAVLMCVEILFDCKFMLWI